MDGVLQFLQSYGLWIALGGGLVLLMSRGGGGMGGCCGAPQQDSNGQGQAASNCSQTAQPVQIEGAEAAPPSPTATGPGTRREEPARAVAVREDAESDTGQRVGVGMVAAKGGDR